MARVDTPLLEHDTTPRLPPAICVAITLDAAITRDAPPVLRLRRYAGVTPMMPLIYAVVLRYAATPPMPAARYVAE